MTQVESNIAAVWADLVVAAGAHDGVLLESFNPSAGDDDIAALISAAAPFPVPDELISYLRIANGQREWSLWPILDCGRLLPVDRIIKAYEENQDLNGFSWSARWLPLCAFGWGQAAVELVNDRDALVIDASLPYDPRVVSPSLASMFRAAAAYARSGLTPPKVLPDFNKTTPEENAEWNIKLRDFSRSRIEFLASFSNEDGWASGGPEPNVQIAPEDWPALWHAKGIGANGASE